MSGVDSGMLPSARGTGSTVTDTEEGRACFQARLALFGFCVFVLAGGSWAVLSLLSVSAAFGGLLWLTTRRGRRAGPVLHALDLVLSFGLVTIPEPVVGRSWRSCPSWSGFWLVPSWFRARQSERSCSVCSAAPSSS